MPPIRTHKRTRHLTPPELMPKSLNKHATTPQRAIVYAARLFSEALHTPIPCSLVHQLTGIPPRTQSEIIATKHIRTINKVEDTGPDPRGRKRVLTRSDTAAIADYLQDPSISLNNKDKPWFDIANAAGVDIPDTYHFKPPGFRALEPARVQKACMQDEGIMNAVCDEEKLLTDKQATIRINYTDTQLAIRPHSEDWKDVAFCNEFYFGIGTQITKHIKRIRGSQHRYVPQNVHRKKVTSKDTKAKAREEEPLKLLNVFVVIGYNYRKMVTYEVPNKVGKMTTEVYTKRILPTILEDLKEQGLTLCQDKDSAHDSKGTIAWAKEHDLPLLTLPGDSPDFLIMETMTRPLKRKFHARRCATERAALARFRQIFEQEIEQKTIQRLYNKYTKRLHDCRRAGGQMTKY